MVFKHNEVILEFATNCILLVIFHKIAFCTFLQWIFVFYFAKIPIALAGILAGDKTLYLSAQKEKGGKQKVCRTLAERDKLKNAEILEELDFVKAEAEQDAL